MNIFALYVRQRKRTIILFFLFSFVFLFTFFLYNLPMAAVCYPICICLIITLGVFVWDIKHIKRKHQKLTELSQQPASLMEHFPAQQTQDDLDYQAIIQSLRQQQNQLETTMNMKYQDMIDYYTIWAHQIKTPIAAMRLTLQNEDSALSRQISEQLQKIEQYVEMVLAFLRLDSTSKDYVFRQQPLDTILKDAVKKFARQFIRKKLRLSYEPTNAMVLTDEKWLCFVVEQILSNSLKYTAKGSITIRQEPGKVLVIEDTGIGIAPEDLPRIAEKGFTGLNGREDKRATGLGLYLCRRVLKSLSHKMEITSQVGKGTQVRLMLDSMPEIWQ